MLQLLYIYGLTNKNSTYRCLTVLYLYNEQLVYKSCVNSLLIITTYVVYNSITVTQLRHSFVITSLRKVIEYLRFSTGSGRALQCGVLNIDSTTGSNRLPHYILVKKYKLQQYYSNNSMIFGLFFCSYKVNIIIK